MDRRTCLLSGSVSTANYPTVPFLRTGIASRVGRQTRAAGIISEIAWRSEFAANAEPRVGSGRTLVRWELPLRDLRDESGRSQ
jgi:hypothetical protein